MATCEVADLCGTRDKRLGKAGERHVVILRIVTKERERLVHFDVKTLGNHPLRLLNRDPTRQGVRELPFTDRSSTAGLVLHDDDGGDVGKRLGEVDIGIGQPTITAEKHVQTANRSTLKTHRHRTDRRKARFRALFAEQRPW